MLQSIIDLFIQIVGNAAVLIGIVALIGLIAQRKPFANVISGTLKTTIGFLIMNAGAGVVVGAIDPLGLLTQAAFNLQGALPVNEVFTALAQERLGDTIGIVFALSFIISILIARFTPLKYIFLSGHHILFMSTLTVGLLGFSVFPGDNNKVMLIIVSSIICGIAYVASPWLSAPYMRKVTGGDDFVMGHFGVVSYVMGGFLGKLVGDPKESTEDLELPDWISFMKEPLVAMGVVMFIFYLLSAAFAVRAVGAAEVAAIFGSSNHWILDSFLSALTFAAGIGVILLGVRMILADIVPAFRGFAEKIVPNAKPALDCPTVFPFAPNAVLIGYLSSIVGGVLVMLIQIAARGAIGAVIIPSMIIHFFVGGTAAVFGNSTGGWKGAIVGGFMCGVVFTLLAGTAYVALGQLGFSNSTFGDTDFGVISNLLAFWASLVR